jgi:ABC-type transporter Mla MlaB component
VICAGDEADRQALERLVDETLLPLVPGLLNEDELFPLWAVRMVAECLESLPDVATAHLRRFDSRMVFELVALVEHRRIWMAIASS